MTPLDTLTHRRRTFQPAVMESGSISYETILHTMQYRGFAAIYDCYLTFKTRVISLCDIAYRLLHVTLLPANQVWSSVNVLPRNQQSGFILKELALWRRFGHVVGLQSARVLDRAMYWKDFATHHT